MNYLLDTYVFPWSMDMPQLISSDAMDAMADPRNALWVSAGSVWEMIIKQQSGKLAIEADVRSLLDEQREQNGLEVLEISTDHILAIAGLPPIHKDPFDRIIIAQAVYADMTLITADQLLHQYPVKILW